MRFRKFLVSLAVIFGIISVVMSMGVVLALLDILHARELDLTVEWFYIWITLMVIIIAQIVSVAAILHQRKSASITRNFWGL